MIHRVDLIFARPNFDLGSVSSVTDNMGIVEKVSIQPQLVYLSYPFVILPRLRKLKVSDLYHPYETLSLSRI